MNRFISVLNSTVDRGSPSRVHRFFASWLAYRATVAFLIRTSIAILCISPGMAVKAMEPGDASTTFTLSQGGGDIGLFSPYRHGLVNELQINAYPHTRLITPNITFKKQWGSLSGWQLSSIHAVNYPILFLDSAACAEGCQLLSNTVQLPQMLNMNSALYFSRHLSDSLTVTPSISVELNTGGPGLSDLSLLSPQFNAFHSGYSINTGIDINGVFDNNWGYTADLEYFSISGLASDAAWEHKAMLFYEWKKNQRVSFGYKYTSGLNSFGYDAHTYPMLDFLWSWE